MMPTRNPLQGTHFGSECIDSRYKSTRKSVDKISSGGQEGIQLDGTTFHSALSACSLEGYIDIQKYSRIFEQREWHHSGLEVQNCTFDTLSCTG